MKLEYLTSSCPSHSPPVPLFLSKGSFHLLDYRKISSSTWEIGWQCVSDRNSPERHLYPGSAPPFYSFHLFQASYFIHFTWAEFKFHPQRYMRIGNWSCIVFLELTVADNAQGSQLRDPSFRQTETPCYRRKVARYHGREHNIIPWYVSFAYKSFPVIFPLIIPGFLHHGLRLLLHSRTSELGRPVRQLQLRRGLDIGNFPKTYNVPINIEA